MSQRNPMNERYSDDERTGKTRKSAASAKPAKKAASSVYIPGQAEKPKGMFARAQAKAASTDAKRDTAKKKARAGVASSADRAELYNPPTDEYKAWRRYWWMCIGAAMAFTFASFAALSVMHEGNLPFILLGIGYVFLAGALIIDILKVRKIRKEYKEQVANNRSKDATKSRKERKAAEKQRIAEMEAEEQRMFEERAAKKQARAERWGKVFGRGKAAAEAGMLPKEGVLEAEADGATAGADADADATQAAPKKKGKIAQTAESVRAAQAAAALESAAEAAQAAEDAADEAEEASSNESA